MQIPKYLSNNYKLILGAWITISVLLIYNVVDIINDFIYNHNTDKSTDISFIIIISCLFITSNGFCILVTYLYKMKNKNQIYFDYKLDLKRVIIVGLCCNAIMFVIVFACLFYISHADGDISVTQQLLISEFETEQCDIKLELLAIYKNTTLNDLNIEHNQNLDKELFTESTIKELELNYRISCIDGTVGS